MGQGGFAAQDIPSGALIIEYIGEVITEEEMLLRVESSGSRHFYFMSLTDSLVIDGMTMGNDSRFINHSCSPNSITEKW